MKAIPALSACLIVLNEADRIMECLDSLDFCDEIVVVDSGSHDQTVALCEARGARVLHRTFDGFQNQKQFAVDHASHDWVICVDADERISPALAAAIQHERVRGFAAAGYRFSRLSSYFGHFLRHGNAYPDRQLRLFDRRRGHWCATRQIHERVAVEGATGDLTGDLLHFPYRSFFQLLGKKQQYARMMAEHDFQTGKRARLGKLLSAPLWRFLRGFVLRQGFRDGWPGLIEALVSSNYVAQKTIMLWLLEQGHPVSDDLPASNPHPAEYPPAQRTNLP